MGFSYEERRSASPFVDVVWYTVDESDGVYLAAADACYDLIFTTRPDASRRVLLSGPATRPTEVPYQAGNRSVGIRFRRGTYFTHVDPIEMQDRTIALPTPGGSTFELAGATWPFPGFADADDLLDAFANRGLLAHDHVVDATLDGAQTRFSARSVQRHFQQATGLSPHRVEQIERARIAAARLRAGEAITDVAYDLGYADQSHLTREVKRLTGYTPGQAQRRDEPV
jgi:AraC-like DNA-binding protein